jgi:glycopeptide antibiotics resistance protein
VTTTVVEFTANVALFVPLSCLGSLLRPRWTWSAWTAAGFGVSLAIELGQLAVLPDRSATGYDILANAIGAFLGAVLASWLRHVGERRKRAVSGP